jgi:4-hydroxy-2-oxoheptanedioate aldolase
MPRDPLELARRLKSGLAGDRPLFGAFVKVPSPDFVELLAGSGVHFVVIDAEHGPIDPIVCQEMVRAAACHDVPAIVRLGETELPHSICRFLDTGVAGVKLAHVTEASLIRQRLAPAFHPPFGTRGLAGGRWTGYGASGTPLPTLVKELPETLVTIAQIETPDAIDNLGELLALPELDVFMIGPTDLAAAMGHYGDKSHPDVVAAVARATSEIVAAGKCAGLIASGPQEVRDCVQSGARYIVVNGETLVQSGVKAALSEVSHV